MFDVLVEWADQTVNICSITDFWITDKIIVRSKSDSDEKNGKIVNIYGQKTAQILWNTGEKEDCTLQNLIWLNKDDFYGRKLQWAADMKWWGTIIEKSGQFNPKKHLKHTVIEQVEPESIENVAEMNSDSEEDSSEGFSSDDEVLLKDLTLSIILTGPKTIVFLK